MKHKNEGKSLIARKHLLEPALTTLSLIKRREMVDKTEWGALLRVLKGSQDV